MVKIPDWLRPLYPFTPHERVTRHGARMSYVDEGTGREAVLLLHGNPTWSFYYRDLIQELQQSIRCVAPDHVGMGLSAKPEDYPYTLAARIDDVADLVESLELERIHLVVHDWGGAIGFGLAARMPERIGRIVVFNTAAFPSVNIPRRIAVCRVKGPGTWLVRGLNGFAAPATWMAMHRRALTSEERDGYLLPYDSWSNRVAVDAFVKDIPMSPDHPSWPALLEAESGVEQMRAHPAMIVWGGRDFCFDDTFYNEWRRRLPDARAVHLADAGHYVLEDARSDVIPLVAPFLK